MKLLILPQLCPIAKMLARTEDGYRSVLDVMLPVVQKLLTDAVPEVSETAAESLANVAKLLKANDMGDHVLTMVLRIAICKG